MKDKCSTCENNAGALSFPDALPLCVVCKMRIEADVYECEDYKEIVKEAG